MPLLIGYLQIILCNPACALVYAWIAYHFFEARIYEEERFLIEFFSADYVDYKRRVPAGIPGIDGYPPPPPQQSPPPAAAE